MSAELKTGTLTSTGTSTTRSTKKKSGTTRRTGAKSHAKTWRDDETPSTVGERMHFTDKCLKWLKTEMDHGVTCVPNRLTPFRHPELAGLGHGLPASHVTIRQDSYDLFPLHPAILLKCSFCDHSVQVHDTDTFHWKNPYLRKSWSPLCQDCARKTI